MSTFYTHDDKQSGDGLAITDWNELSNAVAGNQGLHLALDADAKVGIGTTSPKCEIGGKWECNHWRISETLRIGNVGHTTNWAGVSSMESISDASDYALIQRFRWTYGLKF